MVDKLSYFFFCFLPIWNIIHISIKYVIRLWHDNHCLMKH